MDLTATSRLNPSRLFSFVGGDRGLWRIRSMDCLVGDPLAPARRLAVFVDGATPDPSVASWSLDGITSNERYVIRAEKAALTAKQEELDRPAATYAALIPIRKNPAWWMLTQDERREVFEAQSRHIAIGLGYLPAVARRLHHCRDLAVAQPFDFLTWFEYAPADETIFDDLLRELRASREWAYIDRECDIRLVREGGG
jgi:chlorite dismutase